MYGVITSAACKKSVSRDLGESSNTFSSLLIEGLVTFFAEMYRLTIVLLGSFAFGTT